MKTITKYAGFAIIGILFATNVYAQEVPATLQQQYQSALIELISLLQEQVRVLIDQLKLVEASQDTLNTKIDTVIQNTTTPTQIAPSFGSLSVSLTPQPMKDLQVNIDNERENANGRYYDIYAYYTEDGNQVKGIPVIFTADDKGLVGSDTSPATTTTLTQNTDRISIPGGSAIGARFTYVPKDSGTRTITVTANGVTKMVQGQGQK